MIPGQAPKAPSAPKSAAPSPSPLAAMLQRRASASASAPAQATPMKHPAGPTMPAGKPC